MSHADDADARAFLRHVGHWDARTAVDAAGSL